MLIKFTKMEALGNDFVIINNLNLNYQFSPKEIQTIANRKRGVGCDQVLLLEPSTDSLSDFYYKIYNTDGSIAEQCGNGARAMIAFIKKNQLSSKNLIQLQTLNSTINGELLSDAQAKINLGKANFEPLKIPLNLPFTTQYNFKLSNGTQIQFYALSIGNPHALIQVQDLNHPDYLLTIALELIRQELFPAGVNIGFYQLNSFNEATLITYERGVGFTEACGSNASALFAALANYTQINLNNFNITMPGGKLNFQLLNNQIILIGEYNFVFNGEICLA